MPGHAARRAGASSAATTAALTPLAARMPAARRGRPRGIDRHIRRARAQNAVNRRDGLEALGQPEPDSVAAVDAPARQPGRQAIGAAQELGIGQLSAVLVLHGRVVGPPRGGLVEQLA